MTVRFRRLRLWWMRQHNYTRCWMWCQDCRWAQQAAAAGEFYTHDEPWWFIQECREHGEPIETIAPPTGPNITLASPNWRPAPTPQTWASRANVWITS